MNRDPLGAPQTLIARTDMIATSDSTFFHPELLSVREREVVDLAVEGRTDEQISQALHISTSTVNSYWVRIRGKVGQLSRTEIVGLMLKEGFRNTHAGLLAEVKRLTSELAASDRSLARATADLAAHEGESWHLLALHFVPAAVLVAKAPGDVVYANLQAERLLETEPGAIVGRPVCDLTVPEGREDKRERIREFLQAEKQERMVMGLEQPCYGMCDDGGNFRATIAVEGFQTGEGFMAVFTIREYLGDLESALKALRQPFVVA